MMRGPLAVLAIVDGKAAVACSGEDHVIVEDLWTYLRTFSTSARATQDLNKLCRLHKQNRHKEKPHEQEA